MKIEVAKRDLETALQVASICGRGSKDTKDLTGYFVFRAEDNKAPEVLAWGGKLGSSCPIQCKVHQTGSVAIESWRLKQWLSAVDDAALILDSTSGKIEAKSPKGTITFPLVDTASFPYWDSLFSQCPAGIEIDAKRLHEAFSHVKLYISELDTSKPGLASTEVSQGLLKSCNGPSLAVVQIGELKDSQLRVHGKDLAQVLSFLSLCGDEKVEIREYQNIPHSPEEVSKRKDEFVARGASEDNLNQYIQGEVFAEDIVVNGAAKNGWAFLFWDKPKKLCTFLVRKDQAVFNIGRPLHPFPDIQVNLEEKVSHWWKVRTGDLSSSIQLLTASASKEDTRLNFQLKNGRVHMKMSSVSGSKDSISIEATEFGSEKDVIDIPDRGFDLMYPHLTKLLGQYKQAEIKFEIHPVREKEDDETFGYVRFREDRDGDTYLTTLIWLQ